MNKIANEQDVSKYDEIQNKLRELKNSFSGYHARIEQVRALTRLREKPKMKVFGNNISPMRLARAHTIVAQARSFIQSSPLNIEVEPLDNSAKEDEITSKLERWLLGIQHSGNDQISTAYRQAIWHYFESGQWIIRTLFDVDLAMRGEFPFTIEAIDPRTFYFQRSSRGLMCAAIEQRKRADVVKHELMSYYNAASKPTWELPETLRDRRSKDMVTMTRYYDNETEYLFVDNKQVWAKPHLMNRIPFDIAFCNDIPGELDRPEENGLGIIYPIIDMLGNEAELMTKMINPVELFFYPSMGVRTTDAYEIRQAYPGQRWTVGTDAPAPTVITPTPNYQVITELETRMEHDISRSTFPEAVFGPMDLQLSGYAYTQAMSGLQERLKDYAREPERALGQHFAMLLWAVGHFSNDTMVEELELYGPDAEKYRRSFSVVLQAPENGYKRVKTRVQLKESEIEGHTIVNVSLKPNMDRDESGRYQRAVMAREQLGLPDEFVYKEILKLEDPDSVMQMKAVADMKQLNPEFQEFMMDDQLNQLLTRDKELAQRFEMWRASKEQIMSEQAALMAQQGLMPDGTPMSQQESMMADGTMQPPEEQSMQGPMGAMGSPGMMPEMMPPEATIPGVGMPGMAPMDTPEDRIVRQMMGGGG